MERLTSKRNWIEAGKDLSHEYGYSHIWRRLKQIEDILGDTYDLNRLRELVEADKDGRIKIIPGYIDKACGTCAHFLRIEGTCRGKCAVKPLACSRYTTWNTPFEPSQSRKACKQYIAAEAALAKEADHE